MPMRNSDSTQMPLLGLVELIIVLKRKGGNRAVGFCPTRVCRIFEGAGWS
jgi:hypothetical protein